MNEMIDIFGEPIFIYSRSDALMDGVLVDITDWAKEAGFRYPVAVTANVWADLTDIPEEHDYQSVEARARDLLFLARIAARADVEGNERIFRVTLHTSGGEDHFYKLHCGPGDAGEPVLTILLPDED